MTQPEVNVSLAQIASIEREIIDPVSGKAIYAFDNIPYVLNVRDMPLFVNFPGPLKSNDLAGSDEEAREFNESRIIYLNLYHSAYGTGLEQEKSGLLTPYFALVYSVFGKYPHLKQMSGAMDSRLIEDSGTTVLKFNGQDYFGIRFSLRVTTRIRRPLDEAE